MDRLSFSEAVERHDRWRQQNLPGIESPQGIELLIWLLSNPGRARPLDELHKTTSMPEEAMRDVLAMFPDRGLTRASGDNNIGRRFISGTTKLVQTVQEYRERVGQLAEQSRLLQVAEHRGAIYTRGGRDTDDTIFPGHDTAKIRPDRTRTPREGSNAASYQRRNRSFHG